MIRAFFRIAEKRRARPSLRKRAAPASYFFGGRGLAFAAAGFDEGAPAGCVFAVRFVDAVSFAAMVATLGAFVFFVFGVAAAIAFGWASVASSTPAAVAFALTFLVAGVLDFAAFARSSASRRRRYLFE
jgi:hypothetical protein